MSHLSLNQKLEQAVLSNNQLEAESLVKEGAALDYYTTKSLLRKQPSNHLILALAFQEKWTHSLQAIKVHGIDCEIEDAFNIFKQFAKNKYYSDNSSAMFEIDKYGFKNQPLTQEFLLNNLDYFLFLALSSLITSLDLKIFDYKNLIEQISSNINPEIFDISSADNKHYIRGIVLDIASSPHFLQDLDQLNTQACLEFFFIVQNIFAHNYFAKGTPEKESCAGGPTTPLQLLSELAKNPEKKIQDFLDQGVKNTNIVIMEFALDYGAKVNGYIINEFFNTISDYTQPRYQEILKLFLNHLLKENLKSTEELTLNATIFDERQKHLSARRAFFKA